LFDGPPLQAIDIYCYLALLTRKLIAAAKVTARAKQTPPTVMRFGISFAEW